MKPFFFTLALACLHLLHSGCGQPAGTATPPPAAHTSTPKNTSALNRRQADSALLYIQSGDLIFRTGNDYTSLFFRQMNQHDKTYSHAGIASREGDRVFVYHALGGEFNPDQKVLKQPLDVFITPAENEGYGIFRNNFSAEQQRNCIAAADSLYKKGVMFDLAFDLATDDRMYCSEYVYKCLLAGTRQAYQIPIMDNGQARGVATDNLFLNSWCREIIRVRYK